MNKVDISRHKAMLQGYLSQKQFIKELEEEIDLILHILTGLRAVSYDTTPTSTNQHQKELNRLELIEKKAEKEKQLEFAKSYVQQVDDLLAQMPFQDRIFFKMKYLERKSYDRIAYELHYSSGSVIYKKMEKILKEL